jgi:hypothetical protein
MSTLANIKFGLSILKPGQLTELRLLLAGNKWVGFYFDDNDRLASAAYDMDGLYPEIHGVYVVFNPIKRSALEVPRQNFYLNPSDTQMYQAILNPNRRMWPLSSNQDIETIRWALVDIDPVRAGEFEHHSASAAEKRAAAKVGDEVLEFCASQGCTDPARASSGNGWHSLYRFDLNNSAETAALVAGFTRTLGFKFSNARVAKIDQAVTNAARLTRVYGTTTRKGQSTAERPWRTSKLQHLGSDTPCAISTIEAIAAIVPPPRGPVTSSRVPQLHEDFDAEDFVEWVQEVAPVADDFEKNGLRFVVLEECLNAERRHRGDWKKSAIIIGKTLGYKCHSDECQGFGIGAALRKLTRLHGKAYPGALYPDDELVDVEREEVGFDDLQ